MRFKIIAASTVVVGALAFGGFALADSQPAAPAPITGASIGDFEANAIPPINAAPAPGRTPEVTRVPLGYTDKVVIDIRTCTVTSDTTGRRASTTVATIHGVSEADHQPYTKHLCKVEWPLNLSTVGWSAADITHAPAPITFYGTDTCTQRPLVDNIIFYDPAADPCTNFPTAYEEDGGTMTVLLFNTTDQAATKPVPNGMFSPAYLETEDPARSLS